MKTLLLTIACAIVLTLAVSASGQNKPAVKASGSSSTASAILSGTGKAAVIIIGSAAKAGWATAKFGAKDLAAPTAKVTLTKVAPKLAIYMLKSTGVGARYVLPYAIKLSLL